MSGSKSAAAPQSQVNINDVNMQIRQMILANAQEMTQSIATGTVTPSQVPQISMPLRQVGLVRGFIVEINATVANTGSGAASITEFGAANIISNFSFFDLDNYQRINTPGWHMNLLNTAKEGWPFGASLLNTAIDSPISYGNNLGVIAAPATLAATSGTGTIKMRYWVPLAYSKNDLRGAIYMGVVNATAYLQMTINPQIGIATGDATLACYTGANSSVACTSLTYNVYQVYLDQLPRYTSGPKAGSPILPPIDDATQYRLNATALSGLSVGQDFPVPFTNFQEFLSLAVIYDQNGTLNPATDINYFALAAANTLQFFKIGPFTQGLKQRIRTKCDLPDGMYLFDFRDMPISTNQSGNMQLLLNPSSVASQSQLLVGFEAFALVNSVLGAQSLPAG